MVRRLLVRCSRLFRTALAAAVVGATLAAAAPAESHPLHTSLAELTHDARRGTLQITVRIFADDFAAAVSKQTGRRPAADHSVSEAAAFAYMRGAFALSDRRKRPIALVWCGMRRAGDVVLVCLRASVGRSLGGARLDDRLLHDLFDDQINIVKVMAGARQRSLLFTKGDGAKPLL